MRRARLFAWCLAVAAAGFAASAIPWADLAEGDWIYGIATRFTQVDGHRVHYPTPTAELARLLAASRETAAPRHLADARLALGDRAGALEALRRWAEGQAGQGSRAWAEAARWAAAHHEPAAALDAAARALPGLPEDERMALADERIQWAEGHPELADPLAMMQERARLFPGDGAALERWVRALEQAGRLDEAERALAGSAALDPERRLLLGAGLKAGRGDRSGAFRMLDAAADQPWSLAFRKAYATYAVQAEPAAAPGWRAALEARFDPKALVRLCTWFQGRGQGGAAMELLRQVERRHGAALDRPDRLLLARLYGELDAVPEAFRQALAAAQAGTKDQQTADLAGLARLALRAGGRPLAWGNYNDEAYRWAADLDRTPGFWSGAIAFLFTGVAWKDTLDRLEDGSMPERTFATARVLADALAQRAPGDPELPGLRVAIMEQYVQRGDGRAALDLLPLVEGAAPALADEARRIALLAAQQAPLPRGEEARLYKARLAHAAPDGTRVPPAPYKDLLAGALARMDDLDRSHRAALDLILTELDRMPDAEGLWLDLATRLEGWNLDDDLGPRYQQALGRFQDPGLWAKAARWYARRKYQAELRQLGGEVAARFRGSALFQRADAAGDLTVAVPDRPAGRARMVLWADWVRLKALERFPHSPDVVRQAERLVPASAWQARRDAAKVVAPDELLRERRWAVLFADPGTREAWFQEAMRAHTLEARLEAMAAAPATPVQDLLLFEGWARLSRFEQAAAPADRLAASYPGDGALAQRVLSLHRSLNALDTSHAAAARTLVERTAPALDEPGPLWTGLGEMAEERGRPGEAIALWRNLLAREPRDPGRIRELATLLWDYGHDREALAVLEAGRKALGRPRLLAFEAGVLRENLRDLDGAVAEYLDAVRPETPDGYGGYVQDRRALRRLAQLLSRDRVAAQVAGQVRRLAPGRADDERELAELFPLAEMEPPDSRTFNEDAWIDRLDKPADPVGRAQRQAAREDRGPAAAAAIRRLAGLLLDKAEEMVPAATSTQFLDFAGGQEDLVRTLWSRDRLLTFQDRVMARRAQLAPTEEERVDQEAGRARWLAGNGRTDEADAVWAALDPRIAKLPDGPERIRAEARRAEHLERTRGIPAAAAEWRRLAARWPWSLGLLEDRLAFLARAGLGEEGRAALEEAAARAGAGYRGDLLRRLARQALEASDLPRARRAAERLLELEGLEDHDRLDAVHLLARLDLRAGRGGDAAALAGAQEKRIQPEHRADLYRELARAADLERVPALEYWIEALNRRPDPAWAVEAARSAAGTGQGGALLAFFRRQRERSPRDVRWLVSVREICRFQGDQPGAIEAARASVLVRPDDESLWRAGADLLVRAGKVREAADFLAGWNRPRPADLSVARWRAGLYAQCGDAAAALAVEQGALAAFAREAPGRADDLAERRAQAADHLIALGLPEQALRLLSPAGDAAALARTRLAGFRQAQLALLTGQFQRLLESRARDGEFLAVAGTVLAEHGRPDQMEAVQARLAALLIPGGRPDSAALARWWPFIGASGLEPSLRAALAQRLLQARPGPWQAAPAYPMLGWVADDMIRSDSDADDPVMAFSEPDLPRMWCRQLARLGRGDQLLAFTGPGWRALLARVRDPAPLPGDAEPPPVATWLSQADVFQVWAGAAAQSPGMVGDLSEVLGDRRLADRFWTLAARLWPAQPLAAALPEPARARWMALRQPAAADPLLLARQRTVDQVGLVLGRLLQGVPVAPGEPLLERLRGPRTVGAVLGGDPRWTWPEFAPRLDAQGRRMEGGEALALGQGADRGRVPSALWGERPGDAWYVLETLARYRAGEADAARMPLVPPAQGAQTRRAVLAVRLARAMGDTPLALDLADAQAGSERDRAWLETRTSALVAAGRAREAAGAFQAFVRAGQSSMTEAGFKDLAVLAERLKLPDPMAALDPAQPVGPALLAFLRERQPEQAARLRTGDPMAFRRALTQRWAHRDAGLSPAQLRFWLRELWAPGVAGLPVGGLSRLGPVWPCAAPWLESLAPPDRPGALQALDLALDRATPEPPLLDRLSEPGRPDAWRVLAVRLLLARGETARARALLGAKLAELERGDRNPWDPPFPFPLLEDDPAGYSTWPLVEALRAWLRPFPDVPEVRAFLARRRARGWVHPDEWLLALRLCPPAEAPDLVRQLETAWIRGELEPDRVAPLLPAMAAVAPGAVQGWLARCPDDFSGAGALSRARALLAVHQPAKAARVLLEARRRGLWSARDEWQAFDLWRARALPDAPAPWRDALAVWRGGGLAAHLRAHPLDTLAARSALGNLDPLDEDGAGRAGLALRGASADEQLVLQWRAARGLQARFPALAAGMTLGDPWELAHRLAGQGLPARAIDAALFDRARADARGGYPAEFADVLALLQERGAPGLEALAAERPEPAKAYPFRVVDGRPAPFRPKDLTWAMLSDLLDREGTP